MERINEEVLNEVRLRYPEGTRLRLVSAMKDPHPVPVGTEGCVTGVDDMGHILMKWDTGSTLSLLLGIDHFDKVEVDKS